MRILELEGHHRKGFARIATGHDLVRAVEAVILVTFSDVEHTALNG
eukprot:CAMPEP_0115876716 /NCGR_PEP_ID=MMETSP0287-20121206/25825_1 /TAXON_ID=412157 /ORGANISM="Chrysochromulina rotalis, Strain UIO044" /LENGTH=45 /DNA_ID= /DNA_START= /DNA_END= /DNA_ORIENTATION=